MLVDCRHLFAFFDILGFPLAYVDVLGLLQTWNMGTLIKLWVATIRQEVEREESTLSCGFAVLPANLARLYRQKAMAISYIPAPRPSGPLLHERGVIHSLAADRTSPC